MHPGTLEYVVAVYLALQDREQLGVLQNRAQIHLDLTHYQQIGRSVIS